MKLLRYQFKPLRVILLRYLHSSLEFLRELKETQEKKVLLVKRATKAHRVFKVKRERKEIPVQVLQFSDILQMSHYYKPMYLILPLVMLMELEKTSLMTFIYGMVKILNG